MRATLLFRRVTPAYFDATLRDLRAKLEAALLAGEDVVLPADTIEGVLGMLLSPAPERISREAEQEARRLSGGWQGRKATLPNDDYWPDWPDND